MFQGEISVPEFRPPVRPAQDPRAQRRREVDRLSVEVAALAERITDADKQNVQLKRRLTKSQMAMALFGLVSFGGLALELPLGDHREKVTCEDLAAGRDSTGHLLEPKYSAETMEGLLQECAGPGRRVIADRGCFAQSIQRTVRHRGNVPPLLALEANAIIAECSP